MIQKNIHIIHRLTFGPKVETIDRYLQLRPIELVKTLFEESKGYKPLKGPLKKRFPYTDFQTKRGRKQIIEHKFAMKRSKQIVSHQWLETMAHSDQQVREKIALFWHDHFATSIQNPVKTVEQINWIRKHALGSYKNLLIGVSKGAAMIDYLHNKQNVKGQPNEDFAREVLELFSMGEGNYTEQDIQEAARAFTGWDYDEEGNFVVNRDKHDDGVKVFLGRKGRWTGDDILQMILEHEQTAQYITSKLYYYLTGLPITRISLSKYSPVFAKRYNITALIRKIVNDKAFHQEQIVGTRVKSPLELMVGSMRLMGVKFAYPTLPAKLQYKMDQVLLAPPNVAGWRSGADWITTGTLIDRMTLCRNLYSNNLTHYLKAPELTTEGDEVIVDLQDAGVRHIEQIDLDQIVNWVKRQGNQGLMALSEVLFGRNLKPIEQKLADINQSLLRKRVSPSEAFLTLTSLPEYQVH